MSKNSEFTGSVTIFIAWPVKRTATTPSTSLDSKPSVFDSSWVMDSSSVESVSWLLLLRGIHPTSAVLPVAQIVRRVRRQPQHFAFHRASETLNGPVRVGEVGRDLVHLQDLAVL